ncbi:N-formylglutamate amidohydrolase [Candidatus Magnetomorum sp. HK-1]|nr:N-formylglutamate amidohydrolase [Candidatus Magnetomorum sp. HK-1]
MKKFPIIISIPHGGSFIPYDLKDDILLSPLDLLEDSDAFTQEIYDISDSAEYVIKANIARAIVDLNRSIEQLPPEYPDGIIKSHTCYGKQIYKNGKSPDLLKTKELINEYYLPYHEELKTALISNNRIELALDCHSMAAVGPEISKDKGKKRPLMCLGNVWGQTCPTPIINHLSECFCQSFGFQTEDIQINLPFAGGYITKTYGKSRIPWIQVEMSRALYLSPQYFDSHTLKIDSNRLKELNKMFHAGLSIFF